MGDFLLGLADGSTSSRPESGRKTERFLCSLPTLVQHLAQLHLSTASPCSHQWWPMGFTNTISFFSCFWFLGTPHLLFVPSALPSSLQVVPSLMSLNLNLLEVNLFSAKIMTEKGGKLTVHCISFCIIWIFCHIPVIPVNNVYIKKYII